MAIKTEHLKRCDLITLDGRFDSSTAPELEKVLRASMDEGMFRLVIDMGQVEYFGSAAIRVLVMAYKECRRWNRGDVRLANVPENVLHVFELAGLVPIIEIYENSTLAVGSF
ncbi:MAG: STAS domain-containing protein [Chloroflexi bacterium]|jgi:anti-sigma B factor antagonist|nr:STAS domain-containing protein [Chloroflexota bacterium]